MRPLFVPVREAMRAQAYLTVATFLNEQVLRAVELRASQDLFQPETGARILESHESRGFYLTNFVAEQLEYYQANRTLYPTFRDFVPYLYDQLDLYAKDNTTWKERFLGWFLR